VRTTASAMPTRVNVRASDSSDVCRSIESPSP
jgi:hypothetical protein